MEAFGIRLKRIRESRGLTVSGVARTAGVPPTTYREWEYGRAIKGEPYLKIADALGISVYELLTGHAPATTRTLETLAELEELVKKLRRELVSSA